MPTGNDWCSEYMTHLLKGINGRTDGRTDGRTNGGALTDARTNKKEL